MDLLVAIAAKMVEEPYKLLVVDSLMGVLKVGCCGGRESCFHQLRMYGRGSQQNGSRD